MQESNLNQLYSNIVSGFPRCGLRQHAIDPIKIVEMNWTPFLGMKTLFISGRALSENKQYKCHVLFKKVDYTKNEVSIIASDSLEYNFGKLNSNEVLVRCECKDFVYRFNYYNHLDKSLWGNKRPKYESKGTGVKANPQEVPGMCKHLIKFCGALADAGILERPN